MTSTIGATVAAKAPAGATTEAPTEAPSEAVVEAVAETLSVLPPEFVPRLVDGVELIGEYKNSGYEQAPCLARRGDGQTLQMSKLVFLLATAIDGRRDLIEIAEVVSRQTGLDVSADNAGYLVEKKLQPIGVVATAETGTPGATPPAVSNPLLALRARRTLMSERTTNGAATVFKPLFRTPVVVMVVATMVALDYWLWFLHGLGAGLNELLRDPTTALLVVALILVAALFHECGHAAACQYGGARPGVIGVGIFLVWPAFFTNVTDSYRLSRVGRLRTDLGGLYFNAIFILALAGIYSVTGNEILLIVIAATHVEMLEQLMPFVRFDGYFILSDLVGVPDLFARVLPIVRSVTRSGRRDPRVAGLRRRVRVMVTLWVCCVIPLVFGNIAYLLLNLPRFDGAIWRSSKVQLSDFAPALARHDFAAAGIEVVNVLFLALSVVGSFYIMYGLSRQAIRLSWTWSESRLRRRIPTVAVVFLLPSALLAYWLSTDQFVGW